MASLVRAILSHIVVGGRRQRMAWNREAARELLSFGKWILASSVLAFFAGQSDRLVFGKLIPLGLLGVYSIGAMFAMLPTQIMSRIGTTVLFPALCRSLAAKSNLRGAYQQTRFRVLALGGFLCACAAASGHVAIETLYDPRYADAGWILQILTALVPASAVLCKNGPWSGRQ